MMNRLLSSGVVQQRPVEFRLRTENGRNITTEQGNEMESNELMRACDTIASEILALLG